MTSVQSEMMGKVDSKNASVGQEVTARTKQAAKLSDGTTLPKGTKLVGHVTQVQSHGKNQADSMLAMTFDRAELRDGRTIPLHSVMQSIAPPASISASGAGDDDMMAGMSAGPVSAGASSSGRGGLGVGGGGGLLGSAGGAAHSAGAVGGSALSTTTRNTGMVANSTARATGSAAHAVGNTASGAASETRGALGNGVSTAARATAIPGVMLSNSASGEASGTLTAAGRNFALDSGTQMTLGLSAQ